MHAENRKIRVQLEFSGRFFKDAGGAVGIHEKIVGGGKNGIYFSGSDRDDDGVGFGGGAGPNVFRVVGREGTGDLLRGIFFFFIIGVVDEPYFGSDFHGHFSGCRVCICPSADTERVGDPFQQGNGRKRGQVAGFRIFR